MNIYRKALDRIALNVLYKKPNIPDYHLMVGSAERLESIPLMIYKQTAIPSVMVKAMTEVSQMSSTDIELAIADNTLEVNDLNFNLLVIGNGLGGAK